jgi:membrane-bound serine protease (ClpP class)
MRKFLILIFSLITLVSFETAEPDSAGVQIVYRFPVFDDINSTTWVYTQEAFEEAQTLNATAILLHLNTYGGEVVFADSIRTKILNSKIPVHVFIDNNAASAGALISIACKKIFMRPGSNMGAATVVNQTGEQMPDKYQSYMRSTIRATAEAHGKDTTIVQGDTIVKWIRDPRIAEAMVDDRVVIPGVIDSGKVLTFTALEAIEHGYCDGLANNIREVTQLLDLEAAEVVSFQPSFYSTIKGFLTSPILRGFLILIILGGIYFEMQTPGIGFPIAAALVAAILYFAPLYLDGLAANWEIIIFVIGIILIGVEVFVIPGFGVAGISGIILAVTGLTLSLLDNVIFDFTNVDSSALLTALLTVLLSMFLGIVLSVYLGSKLLSKQSGLFSKIALQTSQNLEEGYVSIDTEYKNNVGKEGVTATVLRPSGKILVENELYDARSEDGFIEKGKPVQIISFSSGQLNVRKLT